MSSNLLEQIALAHLGAPRHIGRAAAHAASPLVLEYIRDMEMKDVLALSDPARPKLPVPAPIHDLHQRHHLLARCIASGSKPIQAAAETGYSVGTISTLMHSPAFEELVEYYRGNKELRLLEVSEQRAIVGRMALEEIQERLADDATRKGYSLKDLRELVSTTLGERVAPAPPSHGNGMGGMGGSTMVQVVFSSAPPPVGRAVHSGPMLDLVKEKEDANAG